MFRKIVEIDEARCDGCGECIPSCAEGAIELRAGKARLVSDALCDGLGACLGECPRGAIRVSEREAGAFDEQAVSLHLGRARPELPPSPGRVSLSVIQGGPVAEGGCPGTRSRAFGDPRDRGPAAGGASQLSHWPVQLELVQPRAPWLEGADLLVAADCVPFAYADFHRDFLSGRRVVVGCPKLDDADGQVARLAEILREGAPRSVTVVRMEVPCCAAITRAVRDAVRLSGRAIPCVESTIGVRGDRLS